MTESKSPLLISDVKRSLRSEITQCLNIVTGTTDADNIEDNPDGKEIYGCVKSV